MANSDQRQRVESRLADILDGTAELELLELVAEDDELRDLRHRADEVRQLIRHAADDFVSEPASLERATTGIGVTGTLNTAVVGSGAAAAGATADPSTSIRPQPGDSDPQRDLAGTKPTALEPHDAPTGTASEQQAKSPTSPEPSAAAAPTPLQAPATKKTGSIPGHVAILVSIAVVAVFGAIVLWFAPGRKSTRAEADAKPLSAKISQIEKSSEAGVVEVCDGMKGACRPAERQDRIEPGKLVRTNARARARLSLDEGSSLGIERATSMLFVEADSALELLSGTLIVDADHADARQLSVRTKFGRFELSHAKCAISADPERASVEVTRGRVQLVDADGQESQVYAGETGLLQPQRGPNVQYTRNLGQVVAEGESIGEQVDEQELSRGLGELRAKKPGETNERSNAVRLTRHHVRTRIVGAIARTEIDEVFTNDSSEVLEGIFRFPLPADAQIERLALEVDGKLVEGAFAERERAAAIWRGSIVQAAPQLRSQIRDEIVWVPGPWRDPALLEWQRGNRFELRIYPIPKQGSRRIVLAYTQLVPGTAAQRRYSYPLPKQSNDLKAVEDFSLDLEVRGYDPSRPPSIVGYEAKLSKDNDEIARVRIDEQRFQPRGDLLVDYAMPNADKELIAWANQARSEEPAYFAMLLRPKLPAAGKRLPNAYAFVVDTSRSMFGESLKRASAVTSKMIRELSSEDRITLLACDTECRTWSEGTIGAGKTASESAERWLASQSAEGASDLTRAVESAVEALRAGADHTRHIVYVGDGTATAGPTRPATISADVRRIVGSNRVDITAVAVGSDSDLEGLRAMARGAEGVVVPYAPGTSVARAAYAALGATFGTRLADVKLELPSGLTSVAPERLDTIAAGDELLIVGRMHDSELRGDVVLRGRVQGDAFEQRYPIEVKSTAGERNAFVPRLYAANRISELERRGDDAAKREAIELSRRFSVASRYTSLLVLESQAMFDAFGLDNRRKSEIWTGEFEDSATGSDAVGEEASERESNAALGSGAFEAPSPGQRRMQRGGSSAPMEAAAAAPAMAASPTPAPKRTSGSFEAKAKKSEIDESSELSGRGQAAIAVDEWQPSRPRRPMIPMRRIWERRGEVLVGISRPSNATPDKVSAAEREMNDNRDRRSATKKLYDLYARAGELERARELAERWSERDPLDVEALVARADSLARTGDRTSAIRILGSVIDVRPSDVGAQQRLSRLWRWHGQPKSACRFATALAEFRPADEKVLADALRCLDEIGSRDVARELRAAAAETVLRAAERLLEKARPTDSLNGDLRVVASWHGGDGVDLDLGLIDPDSHRVSWLGAPTRSVISATNVVSLTEEGLALRGGKPGEYLLELSRSSGLGTVEGSVTVNLAGTQRQIPFTLEGKRTTLALLKISSVPRMVPLY